LAWDFAAKRAVPGFSVAAAPFCTVVSALSEWGMSKLALRALQSCGLFSVTRALSAGMARILMYHNFRGPDGTDPDALCVDGIRRQFAYLRQHFHVVPLLQLAEQVASGRKLDKHTVALTIDDGRHNCYEFLFPALKEFRLHATFFVVSSFIRGNEWIWTDKVLWLSEQSPPPQELLPGRLNDVFKALNRIRPEERNVRIEAMAKSIGVAFPQEIPSKYRPCSWNELREMADSGWMEIGSHTATHPILSTITDEESWDELTRSRSEIEEGIGRSVKSFCYPNGMPGDYRPSQVEQVERAGYACSVVAEFGMVRRGSDRYRLPRIGVARKSGSLEFSKYLDGFAHYQEKLGLGGG
jgi:peptidoglycan/xylan/chitin deacetylase (PgdA/CDA1 family)